MVSTTGDMVSTTGDMVSPKANISAKETPTKRKPSTLRFDDDDMGLAEWMQQAIQSHTPEAKYDGPKWANEIRLMRELDKLAIEHIRGVAQYAFGNDFWRPIVLDPKKLRAKFATLAAQSRSSRNKGKIGPGQSYEPSAKYGEGF